MNDSVSIWPDPVPLTYLGAAIRCELQRPTLEAQAGKEIARLLILDALQKFKQERRIA